MPSTLPRPSTLRVALAQINPVAGAIDRNTALIETALATAVTPGARLLLTPEMAVAGYPAEDLLGEPAFLADAELALTRLAEQVPTGLTVAVGGPMSLASVTRIQPEEGAAPQRLDSLTRQVRNVLALATDGQITGIVSKTLLPEYSVFDDARWVCPAAGPQQLIAIGGVQVGFAICEDVWTTDVAYTLAAAGAQIIMVANASPFTVGKAELRRRMVADLAARTGTTICYLNAVGGQDEVVYDGFSFAVTPDGTVVFAAPGFETGTHIVDLPVPTPGQPIPAVTNLRLDLPSTEQQVWSALVTGFGDYVRNNGFERVIIGLSGGIDSAVAAVLAVDALGPAAVRGIGMPGPYSSDHSVSDAEHLAVNLGIRFDLLPIKTTYEAELETLGDLLDGPGVAVAKENIQARLRALHLMTLANATNALVVNTGNRSEAAVGYFTLGGDASGGYAPLKDLPKLLVYRLAEWRNTLAGEPVIPTSTLTKPPSAELAPDQVDSNTLPPYEILDRILAAYLEEMASASTIVESLVGDGTLDRAQAEATVLRVLTMTDRAEHKRSQVAPGLKVTRRAFGKDRRVPITNGRVHHL